MKYWLMKSEPNTYSIDDLAQETTKTTFWDGVRNYQVRNMLRDEMKKGDLALFYHSNCNPPGIAGIVQIVKEGYPDHGAFEPNSKYFDPKSSKDEPTWYQVDVKFKKKFKTFISLDRLRQESALSSMRILQKGNRLSITPVSELEWETILNLSEHEHD